MNHFYLIILCYFLLGQFILPAQEYELKYDWHISVSSGEQDVIVCHMLHVGDHLVAFHSGSNNEVLNIKTPFNTTVLHGAEKTNHALMFNPDGSFVKAISLANTSGDSGFYIRDIEEKPTGGFVILGSIKGTVDFSSDENSFQLSSDTGPAHCFLEMTEDFKISNGILLNPNGSAHIWDFTLLDNGDIGLVGEIEDTTDIAPRKDEYVEVVPKEEGNYGLRASYFLLLDSSYSIKNHRLFPDDPELFLTHLAFTKEQNFIVLSDFIYEAFLPTDYSTTELVRVEAFSWASALLKADSAGNFFDHALFPHYYLINSFNYETQRASIPSFVINFDEPGSTQYIYLEFQDNLEAKNTKTLFRDDGDPRGTIDVAKFNGIDQMYLSGSTSSQVDFDPSPDGRLVSGESCAYDFLYKIKVSGNFEIEYLHEDSMGNKRSYTPLDIIEIHDQVITGGSTLKEMLINACQENEIYLYHENVSGVIISYKKTKLTSSVKEQESKDYLLINNPQSQALVLENLSSKTLQYELIDIYGRKLIQGNCPTSSCPVEWPNYSGVFFIRISDRFGNTLGTDVMKTP